MNLKEFMLQSKVFSVKMIRFVLGSVFLVIRFVRGNCKISGFHVTGLTMYLYTLSQPVKSKLYTTKGKGPKTRRLSSPYVKCQISGNH